MRKQRWLLVLFPAPLQTLFSVLHFFIQHSAFKLDLIQLPLSLGYQHVTIVACIFSRWAQVFPCCKADTFTVAKKIVRNCASYLGYILYNL